MNALPPGLTVTSAVREGLRIIVAGGAPCPTCGRPAGDPVSLRTVHSMTGVQPSTVSRFLNGASVDSTTLDRLYEWVNARLPEAPR